jgi:glycosyltransferase involved in cell wall biosynthesis
LTSLVRLLFVCGSHAVPSELENQNMKRIRVFEIIDHLELAGAQGIVSHLVRAVDKNKFDIRVVCFFSTRETPLSRILMKEDIPVYFLDKKSGFDPTIFFKIDQLIKHFNPDVVHTHLGALKYSLPSMFLRRVQLKVHTVHNLARHETDYPVINKLAFKAGVCPVAIADEVKKSIGKFYGIHDCCSIPNGIPVKEYAEPVMNREEWRRREGVKDDAFVFVNVGRLCKQKNQQLLIRAFSETVNKGKNAVLLIAGDGNCLERLKKTAKDYNVSEKIHFLGVRTDVQELLGASDVFVLSSEFEGNPLCVMEAMASGLPVISTDVGGVSELMDNGKSGLLVEKGVLKGLSNAMQALMFDDDLRNRIKELSRKMAFKKFDSSIMARSYEKFFLSQL